MTPVARSAMPVALVLALTIVISCRSAAERQAADAAEDTAQVATTQEQRQLWQEAADQGQAPGLERVPVVEDPITQRTRSQAPSRSIPSQAVTIPQGVQNQIRVVAHPANPFQGYTGRARVSAIDPNDRVRVTLELGDTRTLTVLVRVNGDPLPLMADEIVSVAYETGRDPRVPNDVIAIRKENGGPGIAHVVRGGNEAMKAVDIPLFGMSVTQNPAPGLAEPSVIFSGASLKDNIGLSMSRTQPVGGGVWLRVVGSTGLAQDTDRGLIEGSPFTINVLVWRVP
jgi:hypothetical protein